MSSIFLSLLGNSWNQYLKKLVTMLPIYIVLNTKILQKSRGIQLTSNSSPFEAIVKYNGLYNRLRSKRILTDCLVPGVCGVNDPSRTSDEFTSNIAIGMNPYSVIISLMTSLYTSRYDDTGLAMCNVVENC